MPFLDEEDVEDINIEEGYVIDQVEILGFVSGAFLAISLIPQVSKNFRLWSTSDISYSRQLIYLAGLWMMCTYFFLIDAVAGWATLLLELLVGHALLLLKYHIDGCDSYLPTEKHKHRTITNRIGTTSIRTGKHNKNAPNARGPRGRGRPNISTMPLTTVRGDSVHRNGFHFSIDASYNKNLLLPVDYGPLLMTNILTAANKCFVGIVHDRMEIFPQTNKRTLGSSSNVTPAGFAIVLIFANSQLSAHCNADKGTLACDCFARGSRASSDLLEEEESQCKSMMESILRFLMHSLGHDASINFTSFHEYPQPLCRLDSDTSSSIESDGFEHEDYDIEQASDNDDLDDDATAPKNNIQKENSVEYQPVSTSTNATATTATESTTTPTPDLPTSIDGDIKDNSITIDNTLNSFESFSSDEEYLNDLEESTMTLTA